MKILQIIDSLPATSGGSRFVVNLAKQLAALKVDIQILIMDGKPSHFLTELQREGIKVIVLDEKCRTRYRLKYVMQISRIISDFDVVHVHVFPASYLVAMATFFSRKKNHIVFTEHNSFNRRASHWGFKHIEKLVYSRFNKVVCLSEQVYHFVRKYLNVPEIKLCIIQNAIDCESVKNAVAFTKAELGFSQRDFLLLMSARLSPQKNHGKLLQAMSLLSDDVKLLLAGDGELRNELESEISRLALTDRVFFLGSRNDIFSVMKAVDVNILVSNFEGLSLAALEAMSSGKPFIASDVDGLDFVVKDSRLLFKNSPPEISTAIAKLRDEPEWFSEATRLCKSRADAFDIKYMVEEYLNVYRSVLEEK